MSSTPTGPVFDVEMLRQSLLAFSNAMSSMTTGMRARSAFGYVYADLVDDARLSLRLLPDEAVQTLRDASVRLTRLADERLGAESAGEHFRRFLDENPRVFAELLRRESRRDPAWLAEFIRREQARTGRSLNGRD